MAEIHQSQTPHAQSAPLDNMPCAIKASVYRAGMVAGLGIKATKPDQMRKLLKDVQQAPTVKAWLKENVDAEIARRGITSGLDDAAVQATIDVFIEKVLAGTEGMVVQKIATGESPQAGTEGRLEYVLNPEGMALSQLSVGDRKTVSRRIRRVKAGDVLVIRHPPEAGKDGCNVRGEPVPPNLQPQELPLEAIAGTNVSVVGEQIQAGVTGAYGEDAKGHVRVVQEIAVEEVNATTGDLPRSGAANAGFWIRGGVRNRFGVFTSENVLVGTPKTPAALDGETRIRARNLIVKGKVASAQLASELVHGEPEKLLEADRRKAELQMANAQIEVAETFGCDELMGRPVSAGRILVRSQAYMSILNAGTDVLIDGDLVGGMATFGRRLQVMGNMGNNQNTPTRIRLTVETHDEKKQVRSQVERQVMEKRLETARRNFENHQRVMVSQSKKSDYWGALLKGEKRVPKGPIEGRLQEQFFKATKEKTRLEQEVAAVEQGLADLAAQAEGAEETGEEVASELRIVVGGRIFPGVIVEMVTSLSEEDLEQKVMLRGKGGGSTLQMIKQELTTAVKAFLEPREEQLAEKKAALEQMFEGRDQKPPPPQIPNKCFQIPFVFVGEKTEAEGAEGKALPMLGEAFVYAQNAQQIYLKRMWTVMDAVKHAELIIRRGDEKPDVRIKPCDGLVVPWQGTPEILEELGAIEVLGVTARTLLVGQ